MEIYERVYDNEFNEDGTKKENKLLGDFELVDGDMDGYSYTAIIKDKEGELFILEGKEVSGFYHPEQGGTKHYISPLKENYFVKKYLEFNK